MSAHDGPTGLTPESKLHSRDLQASLGPSALRAQLHATSGGYQSPSLRKGALARQEREASLQNYEAGDGEIAPVTFQARHSLVTESTERPRQLRAGFKPPTRPPGRGTRPQPKLQPKTQAPPPPPPADEPPKRAPPPPPRVHVDGSGMAGDPYRKQVPNPDGQGFSEWTWDPDQHDWVTEADEGAVATMLPPPPVEPVPVVAPAAEVPAETAPKHHKKEKGLPIPPMTGHPEEVLGFTMPRKILVCLDGSSGNQHLLAAVRYDLMRDDRQDEVVICSFSHKPRKGFPEFADKAEERRKVAQNIVDGGVRWFLEHGVPKNHIKEVAGVATHPAKAIIHSATVNFCHVIAVGYRGRSEQKSHLGSVAKDVITHAECDVHLVH